MDAGNATGARSLAQETVAWYLKRIDGMDTHAVNFKRYLRDPVIALTIWVLENEPSTDEPSNWRDFVGVDKDTSLEKLFHSEKVVKEVQKLNLRHKVRMEAFLQGILQAVESEGSKPPPPERRVSSSDSNVSLFLVEGLVGFKGVQKITKTPLRTPSSKKPPSRTPSSFSVRKHPQIPEAHLVTCLELYFRSLHQTLVHKRYCVIAEEPARSIKARVRSIVSSFIATVGTVQHVTPVLTRLLTTLTQEVLAVDSLSGSLERLIRTIVSNYVHTTSFASLAFLSSPEISAEQRLVPAVSKYLSYLQKNWERLEAECALEYMLETCLNQEMRETFKTAEFQSIGHLLEVCQSYRDDLQSIVLPEQEEKEDDAMQIAQAIKDLEREVIAVNGSVLPHATSRTELVDLLTSSLTARPIYDGSSRRRRKLKAKRSKRKLVRSKGYISTDDSPSEGDMNLSTSELSWWSETSTRDLTKLIEPSTLPQRGKFKVTTVDLLTRRLLVAASRTGTGGDAYFVVRDLFGGEDVEVVPAQQELQPRPPTVDLIVRLSSVTIKSYSSFDVFPTSLVGDCEPLIQIHTTVTETICLQEVRGEEGALLLQERVTADQKRTRTLSVRPALYEKSPVWHTPS